MTTISRQAEKSVQLHANALAAQWTANPPRWWLLGPLIRAHRRLCKGGSIAQAAARPLSKFQDAFEWWREILLKVTGGSLYRAVQAWAEFKRDEQGEKRLLRTDIVGPALLQQSIQIVGLYNPDLRGVFERVIKAAQETKQAEVDRAVLDDFLDSRRLKQFDSNLDVIDMLLLGASITARLGKTESIDSTENQTINDRVAKLRDGGLGRLYEPSLDKLELNIKEQKFDEARDVVHRIRVDTQVPDLLAASFDVMYKSDPQLASPWLRLVIPGLSKAHAARERIIDDRFYLESNYYRFLASYQTLRLSELLVVSEATHHHILRTLFLEMPVSNRSQSYELVCLLRCLFATTLARLCLMGEDDLYLFQPGEIQPVIFSNDATGGDILAVSSQIKTTVRSASGSLSYALIELRPVLTEWRRDGTVRMRAATASLLAHLARLHWKQSEWQRST